MYACILGPNYNIINIKFIILSLLFVCLHNSIRSSVQFFWGASGESILLHQHTYHHLHSFIWKEDMYCRRTTQVLAFRFLYSIKKFPSIWILSSTLYNICLGLDYFIPNTTPALYCTNTHFHCTYLCRTFAENLEYFENFSCCVICTK